MVKSLTTPRKAIFIIGAPGVGKTTMTQRIMSYLADLSDAMFESRQERLIPFTEYGWVNGHSWRVLGVFDDPTTYVQGTDKMSMGVQPYFTSFLTRNRANLLIEGDRLSNVKSIDALIADGYEVEIFVLQAGRETLRDRYAERGSNQSESFLKGRHTKIDNLVEASTYRPDIAIHCMFNNTAKDQDRIFEFISEML